MSDEFLFPKDVHFWIIGLNQMTRLPVKAKQEEVLMNALPEDARRSLRADENV